ncbi:MAG TPA: hypothetical protein VF284_12195 [Rhodanobacteraceae bacterium]
MTKPQFPILFIAVASTALAACGNGQPSNGAPTASSSSLIGNAIDHAMDRAAVKLHTQDITISDNGGAIGQPKAQITPAGDLLIAGKAVSLTPAQRAEVLAYRQQLIAIGEQGIAVGKQGATLGMNAAGAALAGAFSGKSEQQIRQRVEAQASGIREAAAKICDRLPALMASQQKLAVDVPAFKPYATMTQDEIDRCRSDALKNTDTD